MDEEREWKEDKEVDEKNIEKAKQYEKKKWGAGRWKQRGGKKVDKIRKKIEWNVRSKWKDE